MQLVVVTKELDEAIRALTATLEYEWDGEFLAEIQALNAAYLRAQVVARRQALRPEHLKDGFE